MQLIDRALSILTILGNEPEGITGMEISEKLDLPVSTVHRLMSSLKQNGYVIQSAKSKRYFLSYKIFSIARNMYANNALIRTARPKMVEFANRYNKTVVLCVPQQDQCLNLDYVRNKDSGYYLVQSGRSMPLSMTSAGRVFLAYQDIQTQRETVYAQPFVKADGQPSNPERLLVELQQIRQLGYCFMDEELQQNVQGVAAPVFGAGHEVCAAVAFTTMKAVDPVHSGDITALVQCAQAITQSIV